MAFNARIGRAVLELSIDGGAFVRGAGDAKATMRDLARNIAQNNREIGKQAFQFSGRQQIAEAAKMAEAVRQVGGVTRLVASDQARVNATLRQAIEHYKVLGKEAPKAWHDIERATRQADKAQQNTTKQAGLMSAAMGQLRGLNIGGAALGAGIGGAIGGFAGTAAVSAISALTAGLSEAISKGPQLIAVSQSFDRLTRSIGESAGAMLSTLRPATNGLVSDLDLMLATNKAILLGLPVTRNEMATLARTAITLGKAMGVDATTALDNLITALGRSSPLILDNLGLTVKVGEANERYARALGKTASELTETEQKQAFYNAAMDSARKKTEELGGITLTAADNWSRLTTALGNAATAASGAANQNSLLTRITGGLADAAERAAENMDLVAQAEARLEKQGKNGFWRGLMRNAGFGDDALLKEVEKIILERAGTPANPLQLPARGGGPPAPTDALVDSVRDYSLELKVAEAEAKKLTAAQRAQIAAAQELGNVTNDALIARLKQFGVDGAQAERVLRLLSSTSKKAAKDSNDAAREWQQMILRFSGGNQRTEASNLARAIITGQLELKRMTVEAQQAISKALDDGADAWKRWGGVVPAEINRARAAVATLPAMIEELRKLETPPPFAGVPEGDAAILQGQIDADFRRAGGMVEGMKTTQAAARDHNKVLRDLDIARSEAVIRQTEREGAKKAQLLVMESILEQKKRDADLATAQEALAADEDALNERHRRGEIETTQFEAELARRRQAHADHVTEINEQWAIGEAERRDMIRRESSFWASELGKRIAGELRGALHEATGRLFSTFFARVDDETKKQAKAAREDYERIAKSGRASAEEITRAYRRMREAEEAANVGWANRFKSIWDGIQRHLFNIFDAILEDFVNNLLKGMLKALANSALGQRFMGLIGKLIPGFGGAAPGGAIIDNFAGVGVGKLLGLGGGLATTAFSTAAGGTLAASMIAPGVASAAVPAAIASQGVSAAVAGSAAAGATGAAAGGAAAGGAAAGTGAGAAGGGVSMGFLANPAFWTNPYTIAAAAAAVLGMAVWKKGLFRGGEEAMVVNPERDKFTAKFQATRPGMTGWEATATALEEAGYGGEVAERLMRQLSGADTKKEFDRATKAIDTVLSGGLDALNALDDATANRWSKRWRMIGDEARLPTAALDRALAPRRLSTEALDRALRLPDIQGDRSMTLAPPALRPRPDGPGGGGMRVANVKFEINAIDGADVDRVIRQKIAPRLKWMIQFDQDGMGTAVRDKALE
jgi:hypothetical protein